MNKKLEALGRIKSDLEFLEYVTRLDCDEEQKLREEYKSLLELSKQTTKECNHLLKCSRAIKIMKDKHVEIDWFKACDSLKEYNDSVSKRRELTPEEYELLEEVLAWAKVWNH